MNDITPIRAFMPCVNGCTHKVEGEPDRPLAAMHGHYCDRCYYRTDRALTMTASMVAHILTEITGLRSKNDDGSQHTKKHPPLPFNIAAFDDANEIYSRLVYWTSVFATRLNRPTPTPAARAWRTENNRIVGLPNDITPAAARYAVGIMAKWLELNLEDICRLPSTDDISYFMDETKDIYRINARWPTEDTAQYIPGVTCWVQTGTTECGARIAKHPPKFAGADTTIICDIGHVFMEDEYDRMAELFRQIRAAQVKEVVKAKRTADRLAKKYGTPA